MYVGRDFPPFQDQAARILGFDLAQLLGVSETIQAVTSRLRTLSGTDNFPGSHLSVTPQFSGTVVSQLTSFNDPANFLIGNDYALSFSVTTSAAQLMMPWARFGIAPGFGVTAYTGGVVPSGAQSVVLPASPLFYTLPILEGGYVGQDLPVANQGESLNYGFDFAPGLAPGENIISAEIFLAILSGTDAVVTASPTAYSSSAVAINGSVVTQLLAWPPGSSLVGNVYAFNISAVTSFTQSLTGWARIVIGAIA
jgi:hypothetical protein